MKSNSNKIIKNSSQKLLTDNALSKKSNINNDDDNYININCILKSKLPVNFSSNPGK